MFDGAIMMNFSVNIDLKKGKSFRISEMMDYNRLECYNSVFFLPILLEAFILCVYISILNLK